MITQVSNKIERRVAWEIWQNSVIKLFFTNFISMLIISCLYSLVLAEDFLPYCVFDHMSLFSTLVNPCHELLYASGCF